MAYRRGCWGSPFLRHAPGLGITALSLLLRCISPWLQVAQPHLQDLVKEMCALKVWGLVALDFEPHPLGIHSLALWRRLRREGLSLSCRVGALPLALFELSTDAEE